MILAYVKCFFSPATSELDTYVFLVSYIRTWMLMRRSDESGRGERMRWGRKVEHGFLFSETGVSLSFLLFSSPLTNIKPPFQLLPSRVYKLPSFFLPLSLSLSLSLPVKEQSHASVVSMYLNSVYACSRAHTSDPAWVEI